jgi:predicted GNAT superfamily acetyltransferase
MIRDYEDGDFEAVLEINSKNVPEVGFIDGDKLGLLLNEAGLVQVVDLEGAVEGMMIILEEGGSYRSPNYAYFCDRYKSFAYVDRIALMPAARGGGWGPKLYDNAQQWGRGSGKSHFVCEVNTIPENPRSLRFHEVYGFRPIERRRPYGADEEVVMLGMPLT